MNEEEDENKPDSILDNDNAELNTISPFALMENTALIVKKFSRTKMVYNKKR
jgi:hypothetical protein